MEKYVAFLRGINVGGRHRLPMEDLRVEFGKMGFKNVKTILNSGNALFEADEIISEDEISKRLESVFGFPVPTQTRKVKEILNTYNENPFEEVELTKNLRFYVSFFKKDPEDQFELPWNSHDGSFQILKETSNSVFSLLDLTISKTPKAMEILEKHYGKDVTTRNWNTIERVVKKASTT